MTPKISVIIPVYNVEKYLRRCLDSIKNQTFTEWQAICVDDGSPDNCGKILDEYAAHDKRFIVVHKENGGVSSARNHGINLACGEYIHFMDADDFIDVDYYEKMFEMAVGTSADIVCSGFVTNTKYAMNLKYSRNFTETSLKKKLRKTYVFTDGYVWRYLFKKNFITENKFEFNTKLISQEDVVFVLNALVMANMVSFVSGTFYHYMFNEFSALHARDVEHHKKIKEQYKIGKKYRRDFARAYGVHGLWVWRKILRKM